MYRKLALLSVFLTLCLMALGAYTRLLDAGLGCPDWPGCYGQMIVDELPPAVDADHVQPSTLQLGPWKVMAYLILGGGIIALNFALFVMAFWAKQRRWSAALVSLFTLVLVGAQAGLSSHGDHWHGPVFSLIHALLGVISVSLFYWLSLNQSPQGGEYANVSFGLRFLTRLGLLLLLLQSALGYWVSFNNAGLTCQDFPTCLDSYNPSVDYLSAFTPSFNEAQPVLSFAARAAIHWSHRIGSGFVFLILTLIALNLTSNRNAPRLSKAALLLNVLLLAQIVLGLASLLLRLPVVVVVGHSVVNVLLLLNLVHLVYFLRAPAAIATPKRAEQTAEIPLELPEIPAETLPPPVIKPEAVAVLREAIPVPSKNLFGRLKSGLGKTRGNFSGFLANLALGKKTISGDLLEDIEAQLLMADIGVTATSEIIRDLTESLERSELKDVDVLTQRLKQHLYGLIEPVSQPLVIPEEKRPFVILVVGVNGVGKTTTIGKLANRLKSQGHSVMLAAGDTFRAAAVEQLQTWGERNQIHVVAQGSGADSASVIFDGVKSAQAKGVDVLIADTAGRLHTKSNLMEELSKIKRIMGKLDPNAPHEVLLVLDGGTGQNALSQAKQFNDAVGLTGLAITKLDGTAKGGVVFALAKQFGIPIRFIGVGESIEDLQDFDAQKFIDALFAE